MKRIACISFAVLFVILSFVGCSKSNGEKSTLNIGEAATTDALEVIVSKVETGDAYHNAISNEYMQIATANDKFKNYSVDGKKFVSIDFSVKNIGNNKIERFVPTTGGSTVYAKAMFKLNYNGIIFEGADQRSCRFDNGGLNGEIELRLEPLSNAQIGRILFEVPAEVIDNTTNPLSIEVSVVNSENTFETFVYNVR